MTITEKKEKKTITLVKYKSRHTNPVVRNSRNKRITNEEK